jgi:hypothetical protein
LGTIRLKAEFDNKDSALGRIAVTAGLQPGVQT